MVIEKQQACFPQTAETTLCWRPVVRRPVVLTVRFAADVCTVNTPEGPVTANAGDAVITGLHDEIWPVSRERFSALYEPTPPLVLGQDGAYRRRSMAASAARLEKPIELQLDHNRGTLKGNIGDWLVRQADGTMGIVQNAFFDELYAPGV